MTKSVNKVTLIGYIGKDPEMKFTPSGVAVATFSVATTERWTDDSGKHEKTEWHNCTAWRKSAEFINQYAKKGSHVYVEGKLETQKWEKDGVTHYTTKVIVREFGFLDPKGDSSEPQATQQVEETINESEISF